MNTNSFQRGLSLVELLVSMVIAGIVFSGVVSVVVNSRTAFVSEQESSFIQENARYAMEVLARDIRMAGHMGCANIDNAKIANIVVGDEEGLFSTDAISGFEGSSGIGASWPAAFKSDASVGSDAVILRYAEPDGAVAIAGNIDASSGKMTVHENHSWGPGSKLVVVEANCRYLGVFEHQGSNKSLIKHKKGTTTNCTKVLYPLNTSFDCTDTPCSGNNCATNPITPYPAGSMVMGFVVSGYFIGDSNVVPGMPALKRQVLTSTGNRSEELAQGVESMEIQYGLDTDSPMDGEVDVYLDAGVVTSSGDWGKVVAVRVDLLFRSQSEVFDSPQTSTYNGTDYTDRYLRQMSSTTVRIRNRG